MIICVLFDCFKIIEHVYICSFEFYVLNFIIAVPLREHFYGFEFWKGHFVLAYCSICDFVLGSRHLDLGFLLSFSYELLAHLTGIIRQTGSGMRVWVNFRSGAQVKCIEVLQFMGHLVLESRVWTFEMQEASGLGHTWTAWITVAYVPGGTVG